MKATRPVEGQEPMFYEDPAPEPYIPPGQLRQMVGDRAGTQLNHRWTSEIKGTGRRGTKVHGLYDQSQRIYQTGGELKNFIYWKKRLVTLAYDAWQQIYQKADWIEIIDHERNECWRIAMKKAVRAAVKYDAGLGPRIGVPMDDWMVITRDGKVRRG